MSRLRPCLAEPPAESPSTMKISDLRRVLLLAVGELAGQRGDVEGALAAGELARLARRFARGGGLDDLADDDLGFGRVLLEPGGERLADQAFDHRPHLGGDQLVLGLRGELRVRHLDREHAGEALARILAGQRHLFPLGDAGALRIAGDLARQRPAEAGEVGAAVRCGMLLVKHSTFSW